MVFLFGDPAGIRTPDTLLKRQVLCRLSYWVMDWLEKHMKRIGSFWNTVKHSNRNPAKRLGFEEEERWSEWLYLQW